MTENQTTPETNDVVQTKDASSNARAKVSSKLDYKLKFSDDTPDKVAGREWFKNIRSKFDSIHEKDDEQKANACLRNLTGYVLERATNHGKFSSFEEFTTWFNNTMRIKDKQTDIQHELVKTIQDGKFRPYGQSK
ncbi:hypothetical protein JCM33374_g1993 [Metschnikowia sp. JCM 33374]|nr:hypothetical protein JCM33374_g1993 [Metschnikowia sp. JCM 33374]